MLRNTGFSEQAVNDYVVLSNTVAVVPVVPVTPVSPVSPVDTVVPVDTVAGGVTNAGTEYVMGDEITLADGVTWVHMGNHPLSNAAIWAATNPTASDISAWESATGDTYVFRHFKNSAGCPDRNRAINFHNSRPSGSSCFSRGSRHNPGTRRGNNWEQYGATYSGSGSSSGSSNSS